MTAIAWADVVNASDSDPIISSFITAGQTLILNVVNTQLDVSMFDGEDGPITMLARCMLAAHMAALAKLGATGPVASESEGGLSRSYHFSRLGDNQYMDTSYGVLFWQLIGAQAFGPRVV